jgi:hypothetical protein
MRNARHTLPVESVENVDSSPDNFRRCDACRAVLLERELAAIAAGAVPAEVRGRVLCAACLDDARRASLDRLWTMTGEKRPR